MHDDYDIFTGLANQVWEGPQGAGEPIIHSTLTDPLPNSGTFCRRFVLPQLQNSSYHGSGNILAALKTSIDGGVYDAPGDDVALDLRFHARSQDQNPRGGNVGVFCRSFLDGNHSAGTYAEGFDGYGMSFGPIMTFAEENHNGNGNNPAVQYLRLWARFNTSQIGNNAARIRQVLIPVHPVGSVAWLPFTWYRFRFIFNPITDLAHILIAQVLNNLTDDESDDANWTEAGRLAISHAFDPWYVPAAAGQRVGWYTAQNAKEYYAFPPNMLFDNFEPRFGNV